MKLLTTIRESDIYPENQDSGSGSFNIRLAARAVVSDENGRIALLKVNKYKYHKLPGGGIEKGEDRLQALARELMEEIGCEAEVLSELGEIVEYRSYPYRIKTCFPKRSRNDSSITLINYMLDQTNHILFMSRPIVNSLKI